MLDIYQNTYRAITPPLNPFEFMQGPRTTREAPSEANPVPASDLPQASPKATKPAEPEDVEELKSRLADLEKLVSTLTPKKPQSRKK